MSALKKATISNDLGDFEETSKSKPAKTKRVGRPKGSTSKRKPHLTAEAPPSSTAQTPSSDPHGEAVLARFGARVEVENRQKVAIRHIDHLFTLEDRSEKEEEILDEAREMDAARMNAAIAAGREATAARTQKAEKAVAETKRLIPVAAAAREMSQADLRLAEDAFAMADSTVMERVKEKLLPTAEGWLAEALECKRRLAILERALAEFVADDSRHAPKFHDAFKAQKAAEQRAAPVAALKIAIERLRFGGDHHEAALQAAQTVRKSMDDMRVSSLTQLPKI